MRRPPKGALRRGLAWLFRLRGSPEAIAGGVAIGVFVAFTPTVGFQMVIAAGLATVLGANRPGAIVAVAITNPATIPPAFALTYWVGSLFWAGPPVSRVHGMLGEVVRSIGRTGFFELGDQLRVFLALSRDVLVPLWIGGVLVGAVAGAVCYALVLDVVRRYRRRRERRRASPRRGGRRRRRLRAPAGEGAGGTP